MATMTHPVRGAGGGRQARLESLLSQQDDMLRNRKQILRDAMPTTMSGVMDIEEHSLGAEEQGVGFSVLELTSQTVRRIETALERLEAGALVTCAECRSRIPAARLRAVPFASLCLACQQRLDIAAVATTAKAAAGWKERVASVCVGSTDV
jgi:DnaK suppressor protein